MKEALERLVFTCVILGHSLYLFIHHIQPNLMLIPPLQYTAVCGLYIFSLKPFQLRYLTPMSVAFCGRHTTGYCSGFRLDTEWQVYPRELH